MTTEPVWTPIGKAQINKIGPDGKPILSGGVVACRVVSFETRKPEPLDLALLAECFNQIREAFDPVIELILDVGRETTALIMGWTWREQAIAEGFTEADLKRYDPETKTVWTYGHRWLHLPTGRKGVWILDKDLRS